MTRRASLFLVVLYWDRSARGRARAEIQGRCDGAGSEEIGTEPSDGKPLSEGFVFIAFCVCFAHISLVESSERRPRITKMRRRRAAFARLPYCLSARRGVLRCAN